MDRPLPTEEGAALRVHLAICPACRRYRGQLALLRSVLRVIEGQCHSGPSPLPPDARRRIRVALEDR